MFIQTAKRNRVELIPLASELRAEAGVFAVRAKRIDDPIGRLTRAAGAFFGLRTVGKTVSRTLFEKEPAPAVFKEKRSGLLRVVHKEAVIRFGQGVNDRRRRQILAKYQLEVRSTNRFVDHQFVVIDKKRARTGTDLVDIANDCMDMDEVVFATPNFVSEFRRAQVPVAQWHLENTAAVAGQKQGEDVNVLKAWAVTKGKRTIVIAILDDGVDINHPILHGNIMRRPDENEPRDRFGRDFFIPDDESPEHFDPRPKVFQFPFDQMAGNDIHGTPCAGVAAATGKKAGAFGIAPKCRILAVKIFHGDFLASDARVADAIRYAALHADILSCSWSGSTSADIELAIQDAGMLAPSSGGKQGIFTTDLSLLNRGFNLGSTTAGGADGLHTNSFGGTSSATPLAAGVGALVLSVKPSLSRDELKHLLAETAEKIGSDHGRASGHSRRFGYGRIDAEAAVVAAME